MSHSPDTTRPAGFLCRLLRDRAGNTLALIAAALFPLLALVGGGLDMGRAYLVQARLQQACDAGVLAARKRLGSEVVVTGQIPDGSAEIGDRFFNVNFPLDAYGTSDRKFDMTLQDDFSVSGVGSAVMPTTIMQLFGFQQLDVTAYCSAQINSSNTDVMMVLDVTGSMAETNPGDTKPKIEILKDTIARFYQQLQASTMAGARVRYGFVPYSTNVNVGGLLQDDWMVTNWKYQSRELRGKDASDAYYTESTRKSGTMASDISDVYAAAQDGKGNYYCPTQPADTLTTNTAKTGETTTTVTGPPAGTRVVESYERTRNGNAYKVFLDGKSCSVQRTTYADYVDTYDYVYDPSKDETGKWHYDLIPYDVSDWRTESNGCIEERKTYVIDDYGNVDLNKALDLNIDLVPTSGPAPKPPKGLGGLPLVGPLLTPPAPPPGMTPDDTKWRPMYPALVYERQMELDGNGKFDPKPKDTDKDYLAPNEAGYATCPPPARKLAPMSQGELDSYLAQLTPGGNTYHDIGMIWGGRLLSPTGLFASENAGEGVSRNLIFLTDGLTAPRDLSYSSYGVEPLDGRRWKPDSKYSLTETVEKRFTVACNEVRKRNITVWVIGFGTSLNPIMKDCAGEGHYFEAADATELNASFARIAKQVSDLRIIR